MSDGLERISIHYMRVYQNRLGYMLTMQPSVCDVNTDRLAYISTVKMQHPISNARLKADLHCMVGQMNVMTS